MAEDERRLSDFLKQIARERSYSDSEIKLNRIITGGANFTSKLFTTTLSAPRKLDLHLFSKVASLGEKARRMVNSSFFATEILFYSKIAPKFRELEQIHKVPIDERLLLPEYYGGITEFMKEIIVLEDLSFKTYQCMDRFDCFDWQYASESLNVVARFHALSVAYGRNDPVTYSKLVQDLKFNFPVNQELLENATKNAIKVTDEKYRAKVEKVLQDDLKSEALKKFACPERCPFLCHGDFRSSNILHKFDEGGDLKLALVDYQIIRPFNPVAEIMFFLMCGSDEKFRAEHLNQFFDHYYEAFCAALGRLSIDPLEVYPEKDYREDVEQMLSLGLSLGMYCLPFITVEVEDAPRPEDCVDIEAFDLKRGDRFRDRFNGLVRTYVQLGML